MIQSFQLPSTSNNPKESIHGVNESLLARQPTSWCKDLLGKFDTLRKKTSIKERARKIKKKIRKKYTPSVEYKSMFLPQNDPTRYPPKKNPGVKYSASIDFTVW